ncbi:MAG: hypothetical protein IKB86_01480 [Clostridia bacterium]|nr:hypothetical protein [Clostridia bacterium]
MKNIKTYSLAILGIAPTIIVFAIMKVDFLAILLGDSILFLNPLYLPVFCAWFGTRLVKKTGSVALPLTIFNLFIIIGNVLISQIIFDSMTPSLADAFVAASLLFPLFYSVPISFISAIIYNCIKNKSTSEEPEETIIFKEDINEKN